MIISDTNARTDAVVIKSKGHTNIPAFMEKIRKMRESGTALGCTDSEFLRIAEFIDSKLKHHIAHKEYYLRKETTGIPRTIEYEPITKKVFIHLKTKNGLSMLGKGGQKRVTKSLEYSQHPELLANAVYKCTTEADKKEAEAEIAALQKLKGKMGVMELIATSSHKDKENIKPKLQIITKMYNQGDLHDFTMKHPLTLPEKMKLTESILRGLASIQEAGIVHTDIKSENILVERKSDGSLEAVIADFGLAKENLSTAISPSRSTVTAVSGMPLVLPKARKGEHQRADQTACATTLKRLFTHSSHLHHGKDAIEDKENSRPKVETKVLKILTDMQNINRESKPLSASDNAASFLRKLRTIDLSE